MLYRLLAFWLGFGTIVGTGLTVSALLQREFEAAGWLAVATLAAGGLYVLYRRIVRLLDKGA